MKNVLNILGWVAVIIGFISFIIGAIVCYKQQNYKWAWVALGVVPILLGIIVIQITSHPQD